jgi:hypothetical protein
LYKTIKTRPLVPNLATCLTFRYLHFNSIGAATWTIYEIKNTSTLCEAADEAAFEDLRVQAGWQRAKSNAPLEKK